MTQLPLYGGSFAIPSMNTILEGVENQPWRGRYEETDFFPSSISGAARDAGNTVTDVCRSGLLLGMVTSTGLLKEWNPTGTDGSERIYGVLAANLKMQSAGSNLDRYVGYVLVKGTLYSDRIIIPGNATEGIVGDNLEFEVVAQLRRRFLLDRHLTQLQCPLTAGRFRIPTAAEIAAHAWTVLAGDNGAHFLNTGSTGTDVITLPPVLKGWSAVFTSNVAQTGTLTRAGSDVIVASGSVSGTTYSLTSGKSVLLMGIAAGTWAAVAIG